MATQAQVSGSDRNRNSQSAQTVAGGRDERGTGPENDVADFSRHERLFHEPAQPRVVLCQAPSADALIHFIHFRIMPA